MKPSLTKSHESMQRPVWPCSPSAWFLVILLTCLLMVQCTSIDPDPELPAETTGIIPTHTGATTTTATRSVILSPTFTRTKPKTTEVLITATNTTIEQIQTGTSTQTPTIQPAVIDLTLPEEAYITQISGHRQVYPLGCEASAAVDWAAFFGVQIFESEFQYNLPSSDNPDFGFVGNVDDPWGQVPPYSYGVHAGPVADLLQEYGLDANAVKGYSLDDLMIQISQGEPVIAWVIGNVVGGVPYHFTDSTGRIVTVAAYEHVVIVTGYNNQAIRYMNNGRFYEIPTEIFLNSWGVLGNMAVIMGE